MEMREEKDESVNGDGVCLGGCNLPNVSNCFELRIPLYYLSFVYLNHRSRRYTQKSLPHIARIKNHYYYFVYIINKDFIILKKKKKKKKEERRRRKKKKKKKKKKKEQEEQDNFFF